MYLRKGNLKFTVTQDNIGKTLIIDELIKSVDERRGGDYFGYQEGQLVGQDLRGLLPEEVAEILDDNIEYNLEGNDLKTVVEKIINFRVRDPQKKEIDMSAHVERYISTPEKLSFQLVLERKIFLKEKIKEIADKIAKHKQVMHDLTGLIDEEPYEQLLDELMDFLYESRVEAIMCVISVEGFPMIRMNDGREKVDELIQKIGAVFRSTFRGKDIIGYLGHGKFGIFMVRTFEDEVIYPLRRLESNLRREGLINPKITFNARFMPVDMETEAKNLIESVKNKSTDYTMTNKF